MTDDAIAGLRKHLNMIPLWRDPCFHWSTRTSYILSGRLERYETQARDAEPIASVELAKHLGDKVFESRRRYPVVSLFDARVCIEPRVSHDAID